MELMLPWHDRSLGKMTEISGQTKQFSSHYCALYRLPIGYQQLCSPIEVEGGRMQNLFKEVQLGARDK